MTKLFGLVQIDPDILQEVVNLGFERDQLIETLHNRVQTTVRILKWPVLSCLLVAQVYVSL